MRRAAGTVWVRVGIEPEDRVRWLLAFAKLEPSRLTDAQRNTTRQEARAFVALQRSDVRLRRAMHLFPPPTDAAQSVLSDAGVWKAQKWLKRGIESLRASEKWTFSSRIRYELNASKGLLFGAIEGASRLGLFRALVYEVFREVRSKIRFCSHCSRAFLPVRRQRYCSQSCSQTVRTRKWRKKHPEKNRALRRAQYRRSQEKRT
jgi:hypothetical protein